MVRAGVNSLYVRTGICEQSVISKAERETYPGKTGALVKQGLSFVVWMNLAMGQVAVGLTGPVCVRSGGSSLCMT